MTQYVEVQSLLDYSLCGLAGREISKNELRACVYFCACLPIYDDFFDENDLSAEEIKTLMSAPESFNSKLKGMILSLIKIFTSLANSSPIVSLSNFIVILCNSFKKPSIFRTNNC